jgi:hypothetical protein
MPNDAATVATFTNVANWQSENADNNLKTGSDNLAKSGVVRSLVINITGFGGSALLANATHLGDVFFHTSQNILKEVITENPVSTRSIPTITSCILIDPTRKQYTWNGTTLKPLGTFSVMHIKAVGAGANASGATEVGDVFFHTIEKVLKVVTSNSPTRVTEARPEWTNDDSIYITASNEIYHWNGTEIVKYEDAVLKNLILDNVNSLHYENDELCTIRTFEFDFSNETTGSSSVVKTMPFNFVNGHKYNIHVMYPANDTDETQFQVRNASQWLMTEIGKGTSTRNVQFECSVNGGINLGMKVTTLNSAVKYRVTVMDLSDARLGEMGRQLEKVSTAIGIPNDFEFDYSDIVLGSDYYRLYLPYNFQNGHIYNITVICPEGDTNHSYFQVRDNSSWLQNKILEGEGNRNANFTCNVDGGILFGMVLQNPTAQAIYDVKLTDITESLNLPVIKDIHDYLDYSYQFDTLPLYHKQAINSYMNTVATLKTAGKFVMSFLTDLHMDESFESKIGGISGLMCFNEIGGTMVTDINVLGGDYADSKTSGGTQISSVGFWESLNNCYRLTDKCRNGQLLLRGNHELTSFIDTKFYNLWAGKSLPTDTVINPDDTISGKAYYGYIDYSYQKVRLLFIDTSLHTYTGDSSDKQLEWLCNEALDFSQIPDYTLVVASHEALYPFYYGPGYETLDWGNKPAYRKLFSAFHRGNSVTINGNEIDFTVQGAIPMVYIAGHAHKDDSFIDASLDLDFLTIVTRDSSTARSEVLRNSIGTVNECAFDTYVIDVLNKSIAVKRYGYGSDRTFTYN